MSENRDLFDNDPPPDNGKDRKKEGIKKVLDSEWLAAAISMFQREYSRGELVTGEDVRKRLERLGLKAHHSNKWGGLCNQLASRQYIRDTGKHTNAKDPKSHACRLVVWRVL